MQTSDRKSRNLLGPICLCLAPVLVFYGLLIKELRPVPMYDDYHAILAFILELKALGTIQSRLLFLAAAQHYEYKLLIEHLLAAANYGITGQVHFGFLIMAANLMVLGIAWLFWSQSFTEERLGPRLFIFCTRDGSLVPTELRRESRLGHEWTANSPNFAF